MCRVLGYLGPPVLLADLLTRPANSLVNQSFDAEHHDLLQLGGTGLASWDRSGPDAQEPLLYKSCQPAFYDRNLASVCSKVRTTNLLAHIRATGYSQSAAINDENCHPFIYPKMRLALAHNGGLPGWRDMLRAIVGASKPDIVRQLSGSTDTEPLYALLMSQYDDPTADMTPAEIIDGLRKFMQRILEIKRDHGNVKQAKLKFFLADGNDLVVANIGLGFDFAKEIDAPWEELLKAKKGTPEYALSGVVEPVWYLSGKDYGLHDDQYTFGSVSKGAVSNGAVSNDVDGVVISSEPLTRDPSDWTAVPFQHVVFFRRTESGCDVTVEKLEF